MKNASNAEIRIINHSTFAECFEDISLKTSVDLGDATIYVGTRPDKGLITLISTFGGKTACICSPEVRMLCSSHYE